MDHALSLELASIAKSRNINEMIEKGNSDIQKFYEDAVIFITGGSGFLGKQLIEKLFRSCKIKKIYLLLRPQKTNTIEKRLADILLDPIYDELHIKQPNFGNKIEPIDGDVNKARLGICDEIWSRLTEEVCKVIRGLKSNLLRTWLQSWVARDPVDVIFHGAATVSFVENLKTATLINVKGTIEVLNLGKACRRLRSYVHISTAFSHATRSRISKEVLEKFYESPLGPTTLIDLVESLNEQKLELITPQLIEGWPNTYTFTKAVAEEAVRIMAGDLPICIVRPAIVICTYREPRPGWIDKPCVLGPSGIVLGIGMGFLHIIYADVRTKTDIVPVDVVNNAIIAAGWRTAVTRSDIPTIYTVTGMRNPITVGDWEELMHSESSRQIVTDRSIWYCWGISTKFKFLFIILTWICHYIPAYLIDIILFSMGHKLSLVRIYKKAMRVNLILSFFLKNFWYFKDTNLINLHNSLSRADQVIYNCDTAIVDRQEQLLLWMIGIRKYIVKDGLKNTAWGVKKQFYLKIAHYIIAPLYIYLLCKIAFAIFSVVMYGLEICYNFKM